MTHYFRLTRYFTATSLVAFGVVAATLMYFEHRQSSFFQNVQTSGAQMLTGIQSDFVTRADAVARRDLLAVNEQGNVNLTRLFSNALWASDISPYLAETGTVDFSTCKAMPDVVDAQGKASATPEKKDCFKSAGGQLQALATFASLDARVREAMQGGTIFKIKVYDLSGITVYSTELAQIGEDKSGSAGWKSARDGKAISELTFRDKFSALQGVVENRNLIASYLPVIEPGSQSVVGVFEVYADVTPFLSQIQATSEEFKLVALNNESRLAHQAASDQQQVQSSSNRQLLIVAGLLALLYIVLLSIVQRAQTVIERQARESDATKQRLAQSEKMTSLGQMVAGVAHQLNTPLAFSKNNVQMSIQALDQLEGAVHRQIRHSSYRAEALHVGSDAVTDSASDAQVAQGLAGAMLEVREAREMLNDVLMGMGQMNELVDNLRSFTRLDRAQTASVNLNTALGTVCYIAKTVISTKVRLEQAFEPLPAIECNVSQLNQVFLNLINNAAQAIQDTGSITVATRADARFITVSIRDTGSGISADVLPHIFEAYFTTKAVGEGTGLGLAIARDIVREHGGDIEVSSEVGVGTEFRVRLPLDKVA
ncbi:his Kinase A domain protein [Hydrogenophaga sp. RAC07]|uniref:sensor histidine kinase n=1 Tax=Hydrogenophaga sp. RAC07 TaxID=1842537 RepID=UPI00083CC3A6|nr:ATP-binding protein [Hydrogenophaga sp. RAC07]AOF88226.1 his Kinase A domain protein [Hydrogenophaga sp. RAC07]